MIHLSIYPSSICSSVVSSPIRQPCSFYLICSFVLSSIALNLSQASSAVMCAAISAGLCWTTSNGRTAIPSASASCTWITPRRSGRWRIWRAVMPRPFFRRPNRRFFRSQTQRVLFSTPAQRSCKFYAHKVKIFDTCFFGTGRV